MFVSVIPSLKFGRRQNLQQRIGWTNPNVHWNICFLLNPNCILQLITWENSLFIYEFIRSKSTRRTWLLHKTSFLSETVFVILGFAWNKIGFIADFFTVSFNVINPSSVFCLTSSRVAKMHLWLIRFFSFSFLFKFAI
jgi:hypothetical protein